MTDTGSFRHSNTTQNVHRIVAELMAIGADVSKVSKLIYDTNTVDRIRFLGFVLGERLEIVPEYSTAYIPISISDLKRFNSKTGDTEGFVNYALSIKGIRFAAVIIDRGELVKISFRSIGDFSVNAFARDHFDGGGHKNAAGGKTNIGLQETVNRFLNALPEYKGQLNPPVKQYSDE
jgi:phosphoesterase RecJ-like protein